MSTIETFGADRTDIKDTTIRHRKWEEGERTRAGILYMDEDPPDH